VQDASGLRVHFDVFAHGFTSLLTGIAGNGGAKGRACRGVCGKLRGKEPLRHVAAEEARAAAARAAQVLARDTRVQLVYLFGSAADPGRKLVRDVDLAVLTDPALSLDALMRLRADIVVAAGTPIDIVSLNDAPIVLAHEVATTGTCLYARDADIETAFVTRAHARYWDFKRFLEEQWRLTGERLEERRRGSQS
jgi:predicted nucleotidyltransferase